MKLLKLFYLTGAAFAVNPAKVGGSQNDLEENEDQSLSALASQIEELKFFIADITKSREDESRHLQVILNQFGHKRSQHRLDKLPPRP